MDDLLKSGPYEFPLGYDKVDWFANEVSELEIKIAFFSTNTRRDNLTEEDGKRFG